MKKLITSALPYVNNVPHLGNIIGCVLSADVYARFCRSRGYETLYVCGTDEYGTATEHKAREEGITPQEVCDKYHAIHKAIYESFRISFDVFGRTSTPQQTQVAHAIFEDLDARGYVHEETSQRTYCDHDQMFLADRYVEGVCPFCEFEDARGDQCDRCGKLLDPEKLINPRCKVCGNPPVLRETTHLFLDLEKLQPGLKAWFDRVHEQGHWTRNAIQTTQGWLERGLARRPITRDLRWGIPVPKPGFENKVFYVWFDAPIGYISITASAFPDNWKDWWQKPDEVKLYQFMAKDNIPFHTVMFPASLMGTGRDWTLLHHINSTEYLNYEDTKFSKSRNMGVFGNDVAETGIDTDLWRFYLLAIRPEKSDAAFVWDEFFEKVNSEFLDNIGNLVNRSLVYLNKNFGGVVRNGSWTESHMTFVTEAGKSIESITAALESVKLKEALRLILALGNAGNKFFQDMMPWKAIKTDPDHAHATVSVLVYLVRALATMLRPYVPATSERIFKMLNIEDPDWAKGTSFVGMDGHTIGESEILFPKLKLKLAAKFKEQFSGPQSRTESPQKEHKEKAESVTLEGLNLRVGRILEVRDHPDASRLYLMRVDVGEPEPRGLVAGLKAYFEPEALQGRKVLVLTNLKPAKLRGEISHGMIMAGSKEGEARLDLLDLAGFEVGQRVVSEKGEAGPPLPEITIDQFGSVGLSIARGSLRAGDQACVIENRPVNAEHLDHGKVS